MSLLAGALALAEYPAVHLAQRDLCYHQASPDAVTLRNLFSCRKQESTGRARLRQTSISDHSATPLLVASGAEQAFGNALKTFIAISNGR
jgi:hypothetical protein